MTARLPNAIVSGITVVSVSDLERPFAYSYSVRVPGFAERTGRRLFFQPAFFQKGERPLFATTERIHPIDFQFPWLEIDNVHITLPLGYRLENAEAPGSLEFGPIGKYEATARHDEAGQWLQLSRKFKWGVDGQIWIHQSQYANLKAIFDRVHESDNFVLTLRQK